jgi:hypothetical protein
LSTKCKHEGHRHVTFVKDIFHVESKLVNSDTVAILQPKVQECVIERTAHKELEGKVISTFGCFASVMKLSLIPVDL